MPEKAKVIDLNKALDQKRKKNEGELYRCILDTVKHICEPLPKKTGPGAPKH